MLHNPGTPSFSVTLAAAPVATDIVVIFVGNNNTAEQPTAMNVNSQAATSLGTVTGRMYSYIISGALLGGATALTIATTGGVIAGDQGVLVGNVSGAQSPPSWNGAYPNMADPQHFLSGNQPTIPASGLGLFAFACNTNSHPTSINNFNQDAIIDCTAAGGTEVLLIGNSTVAGTWDPQVNGYSFAQTEIAALTFTQAPTSVASGIIGMAQSEW